MRNRLTQYDLVQLTKLADRYASISEIHERLPHLSLEEVIDFLSTHEAYLAWVNRPYDSISELMAKERQRVEAATEPVLARSKTGRVRRPKVRVARPPGSLVLRITSFVYSKKTFERVFMPAISDMREEYYEATAANRKWHARYIAVRGHFSVASAAAVHAPVSLVKAVSGMWKIG